MKAEAVSTTMPHATEVFKNNGAAPIFAELDSACAELIEGFATLPEYQPLDLPPELCNVVGTYGANELSMCTTAFKARGIALGRVALIRGEGTWITNMVAFPADGYTSPILGIELLVFREKMHLIAADMFPLVASDEDAMDNIAPPFDNVGPDPEMKSSARKIFSRRPIFRRPGETPALDIGVAAMREVGAAWLTRARAAQPETNPDIVERIILARADYIKSHLEDEPANPFLKRAFGEEIGGRLVNEILFPTVHWKTLTTENQNGQRS